MENLGDQYEAIGADEMVSPKSSTDGAVKGSWVCSKNVIILKLDNHLTRLADTECVVQGNVERNDRCAFVKCVWIRTTTSQIHP